MTYELKQIESYQNMDRRLELSYQLLKNGRSIADMDYIEHGIDLILDLNNNKISYNLKQILKFFIQKEVDNICYDPDGHKKDMFQQLFDRLD